MTFDAKVKINFYIGGHEESIVASAEEFKVSSVEVISDQIYDFDFEEATISKGELYQRLKGARMSVEFYTITN